MYVLFLKFDTAKVAPFCIGDSSVNHLLT